MIGVDGNHAPRGSFVLNKDSQQAKGLQIWVPIGENLSPNSNLSSRNFPSTFGSALSAVDTQPTPYGNKGLYPAAVSGKRLEFGDGPLQGATKWMASCWLHNLPGTGGVNHQTLWAQWDNVVANSGLFFRLSSTNQLNAAFSDGTTWVTTIVNGPSDIQIGDVVLGAVAQNGSQFELWINGERVATNLNTLVYNSSTATPLTLGGGSGAGANPCDFSMWDARVYLGYDQSILRAMYDPETRYDLHKPVPERSTFINFKSPYRKPRIMSSLVGGGGLVGSGGIAGKSGGLAA